MKKYFEILDKFPNLSGTDEDPIKIIIDAPVIQEWQDERRAKLISASKDPEWADIGIICSDPYVMILRDLVEFPDGARGGYLRLYNRAYLEGGAAGVVVLPEMNGQFLLTRHFRHATRDWHWEVPRGFGEAGVPAAEKARAEVTEEVGGVITELVELGLYFNNTGLEGSPIHLFLARLSAVGAPQQAEAIETLRWVTLDQLEAMIASAEINDGFTIAAYTRAKLNHLIG